MRKTSIFVILAVLTASLIGCSQQADETGGNESATPPSSFSAGESTQTSIPDEESMETPALEETAAEESEQPDTAQDTGDTDTQNQPSGSQQGSVSTPTPPQTSQPPTTPQPPVTPPSPTEPPTPPPPTDPPKPKTAYDAPYDTAQILADAKAYGESIGMTWREPLTKDNCSWEAPIQTSSVLSGERLEEATRSGIRRVKKLQTDNEYQPGEFHFQLYLEPIGGGEYSVYWLIG